MSGPYQLHNEDIFYVFIDRHAREAHPVQAVRTGLPVRSGVRTELAAERHLSGRECGITATSADLIVPATRRTTMGAGPRLRRRSTARLEQSAGRDQSQPIPDCLQTLTENSLLYSVFSLTLFLITFSPRAVDIVKCP